MGRSPALPPPIPKPLRPRRLRDPSQRLENGTCYWKRMADLHGGDIIDNAFSKKPQVVTIDATDKAFKTSGCQPWQKTDAPAAAPPSGDIPALIARAKLQAWMNSLNNNARNYDGSQVPMP
nr:hypothetical protein [Mycolicibacterium houstonense]